MKMDGKLLLFDWNIINRNKNTKKIINYFTCLLKKRLTREFKIMYNNQIYKNNFLINASDLINSRQLSIIDKYLYIDLAAKRDLFLYNTEGVKTLDINIARIHYSEARLDLIMGINIEKDKIYFKYE